MQMRCNTIIDLTRTICLEGKFCECVWKFFSPDIVLHYHRSKRKNLPRLTSRWLRLEEVAAAANLCWLFSPL